MIATNFWASKSLVANIKLHTQASARFSECGQQQNCRTMATAGASENLA